MDVRQISDMITTNREYIRLKSNIALQNLAMLHRSFDSVADDACQLGLALNDSLSAVIFSADHAAAIVLSEAIIAQYPHTTEAYLIASHEALLGRNYTMLLRYDTGREYLLRAEARATALEQTTEVRGLLADILHDLAMNNHHAAGDGEVSISYLTRAMEILAPTDLHTHKGVCLMGLGNIRFYQERAEDALAYYLQAEKLFIDSDGLGNLSSVRCNIGLCYTNLDRFAEAHDYLMQALNMRLQLGSYWEIANSYYNLFLFYKMKKDLTSAYEHLLRARDYALISQTQSLKLLILRDLESVSTELGDADAAAQYRTQYAELNS